MDQPARPPLEDLLARLSGSPEDEEAWAALYQRLWPFVLATNYRQLRGRRELAEDVGQEVFLRLRRYCPFHRIATPEKLRAYVATVCRNTCRLYVQRAARAGEMSLDETFEHGLLDAPTTPDLERQVAADDLLRSLAGQLGREDRSLLRLILDGYDNTEIAQRLGIRDSAARVRIHRLRRRLDEFLGQDSSRV